MDKRCCICHPEAKTPDGVDGFDVFCKEHSPPKEVMMPHLTGEDPDALDEWIKEQWAAHQEGGEDG